MGRSRIYREPPSRRPKWWKYNQQEVKPTPKLILHLGGGRSLTFDNEHDLRQFVASRLAKK